ncbi:AfsR/SARP family transcriptional regulator [Kitasatospora sp. NPDC051853]|uniref:AfsR/SARP family transcriptional regulator n=1 Tax=Kitasatospora sp. NPDC051853 TaxID=3364058 RepID=UPI0037BA55C3
MGERPAFGVLGPLEVRFGGAGLRVGGPIPARVLTMLLLSPGRMVPVSRLVAAAWEEAPPATAAHQIRKAVAELRQRIPGGPALLLTDGPGYQVELGQEQLDLSLFTQLLRQAREALDAERLPEAADRLRRALALWRGPVMAGHGGSVIAAASAVLEERRLAAVGQLLELRLALGESEQLVGELRELCAEHPLRETFRGHLMLALHRSGRRAEALAEYAATRALLVEELGVEPGQQLSRLHQSILRGSPELAGNGRGPAAAPAPASSSPLRRPEPSGGPVGAGSEGSPVGAVDAAASAVPAAAVVSVATVAPAPCTLPYDLADFTGREAELARLTEGTGRVEGPVRILTVDGMGGSGKTALLVRAAHRLAPSFPDGQFYSDLRGFSPGERPCDPAAVLGTLLRCLGVPGEQLPEGVAARSALWRSALTGRRVLLVLDNAADAAQVRPLLPASAGCRVLVASRRRLVGLDGSDAVSLGLLTPGQSAGLLTATLGAARTGQDPDAVRELAEHCGHLPLALRIAAARLRNRPLWTVRHLTDRLADESRRLDELRSGDRSVEAAVRLSYEVLGERHRRALRLLGRCPGGGIDVHGAAALFGLAPYQAEDLLEQLMDSHLVEQHELGRYALHGLVRQFAQRLTGPEASDASAASVGEGDEEAATVRLLDYYVAVTDAACRSRHPWHAAAADGSGEGVPVTHLPCLADPDRAEEFLDREQDSLLLAAERALRLGHHRHAARLARNLAVHLDARSRHADHHRAATLAVEAARLSGDRRELSAGLTDLAAVLWELGRFAEGERASTEALELARELGEPEGEAAAAHLLGLMHSSEGRLTEALAHLERSVRMYGELAATGRQERRGHLERRERLACCALSTVRLWLGDHPGAVAAAERAVRLGRGFGPGGEEVTALTGLALARLAGGELAAARQAVDRALDRGDERHRPEDLALAHAVAADVHQRLGRTAHAAACAERAARLIREHGAAVRRTTVENLLGAVERRSGSPRRALALHRSALTRAEAIGHRLEAAHARAGLAAAWRALGETIRATNQLRIADALFDTMAVPERRRAA